MTYQVPLYPDTCHEVHLGSFTVPKGAAAGMDHVEAGNCHPDISTNNEVELYVGIECTNNLTRWLLSPQKYAVDLNRTSRYHRITEEAWQAAKPLLRSTDGFFPRTDEPGVRYRGPVLERSGPSWSGKGFNAPLPTFLNNSKNRIAVNSWDGINDVGSILDPTWSGRNHIKGDFWVDIYETESARPLVRIKGSFKNAEPYHFQNEAAWYGDRYYVLPVGGTLGNGEFGLQRLLICDADAAARKDNTRLKDRK
ncbi:MAG TPA: hypothetical protein VKR43_07055 [Bryobacteraceae bacterium]|nr:hypothetical protein [Bryobacteraceae bacterium]